jgi:hypothetical protein
MIVEAITLLLAPHLVAQTSGSVPEFGHRFAYEVVKSFVIIELGEDVVSSGYFKGSLVHSNAKLVSDPACDNCALGSELGEGIKRSSRKSRSSLNVELVMPKHGWHGAVWNAFERKVYRPTGDLASFTVQNGFRLTYIKYVSYPVRFENLLMDNPRGGFAFIDEYYACKVLNATSYCFVMFPERQALYGQDWPVLKIDGTPLRIQHFVSLNSHGLGGGVSLSGEPKSDAKHKGANRDQKCGVQRIIPHILSSGINGLCGRVHALLGLQVRYLPLAGFFFSAIAGVGGGLILDNFNRERNRQRLGFVLLGGGLFLAFWCLFLGLP